jgi:hypothetical protein
MEQSRKGTLVPLGDQMTRVCKTAFLLLTVSSRATTLAIIIHSSDHITAISSLRCIVGRTITTPDKPSSTQMWCQTIPEDLALLSILHHLKRNEIPIMRGSFRSKGRIFTKQDL